MIYLFVLDDSLSSYRLMIRTEQLNKCYKQLQKIKVGLDALLGPLISATISEIYYQLKFNGKGPSLPVKKR